MARLALALALCFIGAANGFGVTPPAREECPDVNIDRGAACDVAGEACDIYAGEDIFYDAGVCLQIEIPDVSTGAYIKLLRRVAESWSISTPSTRRQLDDVAVWVLHHSRTRFTG